MSAPESEAYPSQTPFHLAFPVHDLQEAREFYGKVLGCSEGRSSDRWVDFDLHGHQIVAHLASREQAPKAWNPVDGDAVPVPHFGLVLEWSRWHDLVERLKEHQVHFLVGPRIRFQGQAGEQATVFFMDPSGNALEFKSFKDPSRLFARD
ncbi:MAG: glyoxalase [Planctomycetota bacterium]|nr:MAG: glyoxalase [Planctomycetota bacterium]